MNENTKTPIEELAATLARMTERAMTAEKERDEVKARSLDWYKSWERADKAHKEAQAALAAEIREHQATTAKLDEAAQIVKVLTDELERANNTHPAETDQRSGENKALCRENV